MWNITMPPAEWFTATTGHDQLQQLIKSVSGAKYVAIDTETTGLDIMRDKVLYWSLCWDEEQRTRRCCLRVDTLRMFDPVFSDPDKEWVLANAKYDMHLLNNMGVTLHGRCNDTAVQHAMLYEEEDHDLKYMVSSILGWGWSDFKTTFNIASGSEARKPGYIGSVLQQCERTDLDKLVEYASNDAYGTYTLFEELQRQLKAATVWGMWPDIYSTLWDLFDKIEVPFTKTLWRMERAGIKVDFKYLESIEPTVREGLNDIKRNLAQATGRIINPGSNAQLADLFFRERGHKPIKYTRTGQPSTDADVIEDLAEKDDLAKMILKYRKLEKIYGTYIVGLMDSAGPDGRIHTRFNQANARTGRLSSSDPNLLNIPRPNNDDYKLRGAFVAEEGNELVVGDEEQIEMRLIAEASQQEEMIDIFKKGWDIHSGNTAMMMGFSYEEVEAARAIEKKVKKGELPKDAFTSRMNDACKARDECKVAGFG